MAGTKDSTGLAAVEAAHAAATGTWTGADWTHELRRDGRDVYEDVDGHDEAVYCSGESDCERCRDAERDAAGAEVEADEALEHAREGRWDEALGHAEEAARLEGEWGDSPTWRPLVEAIEGAAATRCVICGEAGAPEIGEEPCCPSCRELCAVCGEEVPPTVRSMPWCSCGDDAEGEVRS